MMGIIHSIVRFVDSCCELAAGIAVIFCITNIETPTSTGRRKGTGFALENLARSSQRKVLSKGTAWLIWCGHG